MVRFFKKRLQRYRPTLALRQIQFAKQCFCVAYKGTTNELVERARKRIVSFLKKIDMQNTIIERTQKFFSMVTKIQQAFRKRQISLIFKKLTLANDLWNVLKFEMLINSILKDCKDSKEIKKLKDLKKKIHQIDLDTK